MPAYLVELEDGKKYRVESDTPPTEQDIAEYLGGAAPAAKDEPLFDLSDTLSAAGQAVKGLPTTAPHAFRQLYEGLENPWKRGEGYLKSQEAVDAYQQELEAANLEAEKSGDISTLSRGMRQAGQSLGFSVGAMGAGLVTSTPSAAAGRAIGRLAGPKGAVAGEIIGRGAGALAAGYGAAYRMAGAQFLDDARKEIDAKFLSVTGRLPNEQEQEEAYQELLPLAQAFGNAEAGPEAIGNLAMAGAGKYVFGLGRKTIEKLAASALGKTGAAAGALATELGGETVTGVEQNRIEAQKQAMYRGEQPEETPRTMEEYAASLKEVAPATLATMGLMSVPPATVKAVQSLRGKPAEEQPAPDTDFARRAAMEGATEFRDTTAGVPVVVEGITIATIPPGSDLSPDDVAAFAAEPDMLKTLARSGQITLPEIVKPVENVDPALTEEMNDTIAAGAATAPATVTTLEEMQALYEAQTLARERQAAEETLRQQEAERAAAEEQEAQRLAEEEQTAAREAEERRKRYEAMRAEQSVKLELTPDESGATGAGMKEEIQQTPLSSLPKGTLVDYQGEQFVVVGTENDGRVVVSNRTGGYLDLPKESVGSVVDIPPNPYAKLVDKEEPDFGFLDRVGATRPPDGLETVPSGDLPLGTTMTKVGGRSNGNPPPVYAITPDGRIYSDSGRSMTHGGASPWRLEYVTSDFTAPQSITPTGEEPTDSLPADQPTSGDVGTGAAVQRDPSKPEQMTPEEYRAADRERFGPKGQEDVLYEGNTDEGVGKAMAWHERNRAMQKAGFDSGQAIRDLDAGVHPTHAAVIRGGVKSNLPVSAEAVDTYGIKLPEGYVRQGELYVFQPTVTTANETPIDAANVDGGSQGVQTEPAEGSISAVTTATVPPAATESTGEVQPAKVLSRGKPRESIVFKNPVRTPLGDVIGYSWSSQLVEDVDKDGEPILRRVSNWEEAANNAETGRDIVHRFLIRKPDGSVSEVSLESTLGKMTPADKKTIKSVISAAKRLPFMRVELAELQDLQKRSDEDYRRTQKLVPDPTKFELREPDVGWRKGTGDKVAYLDDVFLGYVSGSDLDAKGELPQKARFIYENAWKWQGAQRKVEITPAQTDRLKSLTRSVKKAEELLKKENVEVAKVTADEQPPSLAEAGPPVREMKTPSVTTDRPAPTSKRPSLGSAGKQIIDAWRSFQGVQVAPGETVVGWDVNGGGTYAFINDRLVKLRRNDKGFETTYTEATDSDWQNVSGALDRGALQVEVRKITGLGGYQKADAGKTVRVLHQATGRPLQEFLDTSEGVAYEARMQKAVAERGPKEAPRSPAENLVSFTAANGQKLVGEVQSVTGNKATVAYQWNGKTKTQVVPVSQLGSPVASVATPPKYLYNQEQNTRKLGKHFPTTLGVHTNHDFRKSFASMAKDTSLGQGYQMIARMLSKMPEFKGMDLHLVADENIKYAGEYSWNEGKPSIAINLRLIARGQVDALGSILHEALHHVTLAKVRNPQGAFENEVVSKLDLIRESVREYAESRGFAEALEYELGSTEEFITALFTRPDFQALIASIPDSAAPGVAVGKFRSLLSEIFRLIAELVHGKPVLRGSALEQAMTTSLALFNTPFRGIETGGLEALNAARSYAGERAQMPQFMRDSLETAQAMAAAGKTSEEIRAVTGWFPGKYDGKMRWEIPDDGFAIDSGVLGDLKSGRIKGSPLGDLFIHPAIFEAYPELKDVAVVFADTGDASAQFTELGKGVYAIRLNAEKWSPSAILHEVQHWVQRKEGFATGSSPDVSEKRSWEQILSSHEDNITELSDAWSLRNSIDNGSTLPEAKGIFESEYGRKPHETAGQLAKAMTKDEINAEVDRLAQSFEKSRFLAQRGLLGDAYKQYFNTAGEIEARDVQARQAFTPEQRKAVAPYSSENIAKEDAIVMFGGSGAQASMGKGLKALFPQTGDKAAKPSALAEQWWAATTRQEARAILEPASLEELKAIAVRMDENPNQSKAKLIDRLVQITGVYADAVGIRGADVIGPRGPMPDYTGQTAAAQQRMREQKAARAQQPKERGLPKAKPRTPEEFARDMAALMARPASETKPINLSAAYQKAATGKSSQWVPIKEVYEQAKADNPSLTPEAFMAQVEQQNETGGVMISPVENVSTVEAARPFVVGNAGVEMLVPGGTAASRIDEETDTEYLAAVEAGDMGKAQQMVDAAAWDSGYQKLVVHQTHQTGIREFDRSRGGTGVYEWDNIGIWTTTEDTPTVYGPVKMRLFGRMENPKRYRDLDAYDEMLREYFRVAYREVLFALNSTEVESDQLVPLFRKEIARLAKEDGIEGSAQSKKYQAWLKSRFPGAEGFRQYLKTQGYDGIQIDGAFWDGEIQTVRVFLEPNQIKSADPATYDEQGNVIPLSQRFNPESPSIAYSRADEGEGVIDIGGAAEPADGGGTQLFQKDPTAIGSTYITPADITLQERRSQEETLAKARKIIAEEVQKDEKGGRAVALQRFKSDLSIPPEVRAAGTGLIAQQADLLANLERDAIKQEGLDALADEAGKVSGIIGSDLEYWRNLQLAANLDIDKMAKEAGRTLNIFNVFRRLTPEGFLRRMKRQYNATVQESMAQNFDIPPGEVEAEIMRLWRMMREAGATARGEAIAAALKAFMPRQVNTRKIIESLFPQAGTRQRMSKGGEALVRNFFQMMAGPRDQKGPLAEFDESIQNALSGMLRKVMEAKGLVAKNQSNQATDIDKLVRSVSADELRFDKIAAADEAMQQELDAIEDPERRATLRQAWEEATAKMYTNIASDATVRRAINAELKGMNVDWRKMFDSNQKPDAIKAKVVDAVMTKIEGLLTNAADPTVRQNLNMLRDEVEAAFDFIASNKRTEWLAYREEIEARRRVAEHRAAFMEALRNQGVAEDALLRISKKLLAGPLPQKPDQNPVSALVGEHMKGEVPNFVDKLVALDVDRATAEQLDTAAKALRADIAEVEKLKAAERAVKKLMDSLKPKPRAPREKIEKALKALFTAAETGALDSQEFFDALGEALGHPPLTPAQQEKIKKLTREINALPKGAARIDKQQELDEELALWKGIAARDVLLSAWYANILSGISTQGIGLFGNLVNFIPRSLFLAATNPRSAKAYLQGAFGEGLETGLREAKAALKGRGLYKVSKYGDKNMVSALELLRKKGPATLPEWIAYIASGGTRLRYVFRIMQAIDALAWNTAREGQAYLAAHRALLDQQRADGVKRTPEEFYRALIDNLGGDAKQIEEDMRAAREELIARGQTPDLLTVDRMAREARNARRSSTATKLSNRFADRIVMQQDPEGIGDVISSIITVIQKKGNFMGVPFGQLLIPFNKIVANLFEQSLDYTPVGALRSYFGGHLTDIQSINWSGKAQFKDKAVQFDAVERAERMAASVTGTLAASVMFALASLFKDEPDEDVPFMLYGFGPESKNKRDQMPKGWTPYSAKIGDTYIKFSEMPFGVMFAAAGNALDAMRYKNMDKKSSAERLAYVLKTSAKGFTEQGVLSSFDTALEVLTFQASDKKFTDVPVNIAKGMVPAQGMLRDMSVLFDPVKIKDDTISAALLRDFPVVRRIGTRPALNVFGEPVTFDGRIPFVRRIATVREEHAAADYLGRNKLSIPGMAQTIVVGQYLPKDMRDRIQRRALETSAMENGVFTVEQDYNFRKRAGELTKVAVENLMKQVPTITSDRQRENVQKLINKKVEIARRRAMLEAVPAQ